MEAAQAIVDALQPLTVEVPGLQVVAGWSTHPTPPCIDVYPAREFQAGAGMGVHNKRVWFTVRARASTVDEQAANDLLFRLLDPAGPASVEAALAEDDTAVVDNERGQVTGFGTYPDSPDLLGCDWTVGVFL